MSKVSVLVVDDAIVVLENIHRHIENGMGRLQAALIGTREIGFAVVAIDLRAHRPPEWPGFCTSGDR